MKQLEGKCNIRCQAITIYPGSSPPNGQCQHLSSYYHTGKYYCRTHASRLALEIVHRHDDMMILAKRVVLEALPKFNWGASALDANAITLLNNFSAKVNQL